MKDVIVAVHSFLRHEEIKFEQTHFDGVLKLGFIGDNGCFLGYVDADEERRAVQVRTIAPVRVERSKMPDVAELLMRVNCRLLLGNLELNMDSGTIVSRTGIVLGESDLHHEVMEHLLYANWLNMDRFFPAVNAVLFGNISPRKALDRVLQQRPDPPDDAGRDESPGGRLRDILGGSSN
jgi:hypothetical protein